MGGLARDLQRAHASQTRCSPGAKHVWQTVFPHRQQRPSTVLEYQPSTEFLLLCKRSPYREPKVTHPGRLPLLTNHNRLGRRRQIPAQSMTPIQAASGSEPRFCSCNHRSNSKSNVQTTF